ncbi:MAG: hypothetical protein EOO24_56385, partial [Comamonadaceae bacterium]
GRAGIARPFIDPVFHGFILKKPMVVADVVIDRILHEFHPTGVQGRSQFGQPVANFQLVQAMVADSQVEIYAARSMILEAARARDRGEDVALTASMCKYYASEMCGRVADRCVQLFGGAGYIADFSPIERYYRDVRLFRLYEGTSQIHQLNIAKLVLRSRVPA